MSEMNLTRPDSDFLNGKGFYRFAEQRKLMDQKVH